MLRKAEKSGFSNLVTSLLRPFTPRKSTIVQEATPSKYAGHDGDPVNKEAPVETPQGFGCFMGRAGKSGTAALCAIMALSFVAGGLPNEAHAQTFQPAGYTQRAQVDSVSATQKARLERTIRARVGGGDSTYLKHKWQRDLFDFMYSGITNRQVTPYSRIIGANGTYREVKNQGELGQLYVSGIGSNGVWAALGLAPTAGGQGSYQKYVRGYNADGTAILAPNANGNRHGMTAYQAAAHYSDIDTEQRFTVYPLKDPSTGQNKWQVPDRYDFDTSDSAGIIAGERPAEGRLVNPIDLYAPLQKGWNMIIYNPFPVAHPELDCHTHKTWSSIDGQRIPIPAHQDHDYQVSDAGNPEGRVWFVWWDGT